MRKGFTLLEVLLSIALLGLIAGFTTPIYSSFQNRNDLDIAISNTVQSLRRAQLLAQASSSDTSWGIKLQAGSLTIFRGSSFAARDSNFDEIYPMSTGITLSNLNEIVFDKFSGLPTGPSVGTITLTDPNNETKNITINAKGMFDY